MSSPRYVWASLAALLLGCQAYGRASARVQTGGTTSLEVHAGDTTSLDVHAGAGVTHVHFAGGKLAYTGEIKFETGEATLTGDRTSRTLDSMARYLDQHPDMKVRIEGHTDNVGTDAYNHLLSHRRANAVRGWLEEHGIAADRLSSVGYGESRPVATNDTEEGRARNRRVDFVVIEGAPPQDEPEPVARTPEPAPAAPIASESPPSPRSSECPESHIGFHANALDPLGLVGADFAYQPTSSTRCAVRSLPRPRAPSSAPATGGASARGSRNWEP